ANARPTSVLSRAASGKTVGNRLLRNAHVEEILTGGEDVGAQREQCPPSGFCCPSPGTSRLIRARFTAPLRGTPLELIWTASRSLASLLLGQLTRGPGNMVTNYPHPVASNGGIRTSGDEAQVEGSGVMDRVRQMFCGLHGHDNLLQFEQDRMFLKCVSCGRET